jgi:phospholipase A1
MRHTLLLTAAALLVPLSGAAQTPAACAALGDDARRLACYDELFRAAPVPPAAAASAPAPAPLPVRDEPTTQKVVATAPSGGGLDAEDYLAKFWELDHQRDTFVVRTYGPNFLLPLHVTSRVNRSPSSSTHPDGGTFPYGRSEAELQVSLRAKVFGDAVFHNDSLWLAYSQQSIWQLWNSADSSPFRSSDYQPEAMYVAPIPESVGTFAGWRWRLLLAGFAHESNGQSDPLSRSWNRLYLGTAFTRDDVAVQARYNWRTPETGVDDNPGLTDYIGSTELSALWFPGVSTMQLSARTSFKAWDRGSLRFVWTHPVFGSKPDGLRWYLQLFSGYGETLLDYNHRQNSVGLGFTLFQL